MPVNASLLLDENPKIKDSVTVLKEQIINKLIEERKFKNLNGKDYAVKQQEPNLLLENAIWLIPGKKYSLKNGETFRWTHNQIATENINNNVIEKHQSKLKANSLDILTRLANNEIGDIIFSKEKLKHIADFLKDSGIDINKNFYINGKQFRFSQNFSQLISFDN